MKHAKLILVVVLLILFLQVISAVNYGKIKVTSSPSKADVYITGKQVGKTPYSSGKLAKGTYYVAVKKEGYEDYKTKVKVVANKTTPVHAKLKALRTYCT